MPSKTDIRDFSNAELSLLVFNTEYLYKLRSRRPLLFQELNDLYEYTQDQLAELIADLDADDSET